MPLGAKSLMSISTWIKTFPRPIDTQFFHWILRKKKKESLRMMMMKTLERL